MKKLVKIAAVLLAVGIILIAAGLFRAHKDNVSASSIYGAIEDNLKLGESNVAYTPPERFDFGSMKNLTTKGRFESELNEFNTLELYAEGCEVTVSVTDSDMMTASGSDCTLVTGISGGTLHIEAVNDEGSGELAINMPDSYKGGCVINAESCDISLDSFESAMDVSFNIRRSKFRSNALSADNISVMTNNSEFSAADMNAVENIRIDGESSEFDIKKLTARSTGFTVNNTTASLSDINGAITTNARMSALKLGFSRITGNIGIDATGSNADVTLPENANITLRHKESYGMFRDKTKSAQNDSANLGDAYTMETNIKFGIVTAAN